MPKDRSSRPFWLGEDRRQWDHVRVHLAAIKDQRLGAIELAVYIGLIAHAEIQGGVSKPSKATLASYAGVTDRRVYDAIQTLSRLGYIEVRERPGAAHEYTVLPPPTVIPTLEPGSTLRGVTLERDDADPGTKAPEPWNVVPTNKKEQEHERGGRAGDPLASTAEAQRRRFELTEARKLGKACSDCFGVGVVETDEGCDRCKACDGTGVAA